MAYVADLHLHSRFAYACSKELNIPNLALWAKIKGIDLLSTGDCLHPVWREELKKYLTDRGDGLYSYDNVKFVVCAEVSCIYTEDGHGRRIHILIYLPSLQRADMLANALEQQGCNLKSDGRPILNISVKKLCQIVWEVEPKAVIIPAHIWTPWFGMYGSKSGYDFFRQCFGEYADKIPAIETGMSSDPAMNWRVAELDNKTILSFSDAHSLPNIGRELTIFGGNLSYDELVDDIKEQNIVATIEFYPEEGMYHFSGHRKCEVVLGPDELRQNGELCPVCKKPLTIGVMQRVEELATRSESDLKLVTENGITKSQAFLNRPPYQKLVELDKIIADAFGVGRKSKKVQQEFEKLTSQLGNELFILTKASFDHIKTYTSEKVAEGIIKARKGEVEIKPGYDGTYGEIAIWGV